MKYYLCIIAFYCAVIVQAQPSFNRLLDLRNAVEDQSDILKGEDIDEKIKKNFFLKAEVSKTDCYVGEVIMATFKAYSRLNASSRVVKRPALTGFSVMEMVDAYNSEPDVETVNKIAYNMHLIRKVQLFPLQAGSFSLEPAVVESDILFRNPKTTKNISLETPAITITVKPLPEKNQPDSFSGAVGNFYIVLKMANQLPYQYDPVSVKLIIGGTGNFPLITDPDISWPEGTGASRPQVTEVLNKYVFPLSGEKIFEYALETRATGDFIIPPVSFTYFDPGDAKYKKAVTGSIHYTVKKDKRKINLEKIIRHPRQIPIQYYYFGVIALGIAGWIIYLLVKSKK